MLPDNVTTFRDRHGKARYRYRKTGQATYYFKAEPGTNEFLAELKACRNGLKIQPGADRAEPGTVNDLCARYYRSQDFDGQSAISRQKNRAIIESFRAEHGPKRVATITFEHLDAILARRAVRLAYSSGRLDFKDRSGGLELHPDFRSLALANGVDPDDDALKRCRPLPPERPDDG